MTGLTKAWRAHNGDRCLTVNEGGSRGATLTIFLSRRWMPRFIYVSANLFGTWRRAYWRV
jgi:hypothetical protein